MSYSTPSWVWVLIAAVIVAIVAYIFNAHPLFNYYAVGHDIHEAVHAIAHWSKKYSGFVTSTMLFIVALISGSNSERKGGGVGILLLAVGILLYFLGFNSLMRNSGWILAQIGGAALFPHLLFWLVGARR